MSCGATQKMSRRREGGATEISSIVRKRVKMERRLAQVANPSHERERVSEMLHKE